VYYEIGAVQGADLQADGYTGRAKTVVDEDRRCCRGLPPLASGVVDHLHAGSIAVRVEIPLDRIWHAVPACTTTSEVWLELLEAYGV
jgi:dihydrolipoamide dehydrogenase